MAHLLHCEGGTGAWCETWVLGLQPKKRACTEIESLCTVFLWDGGGLGQGTVSPERGGSGHG